MGDKDRGPPGGHLVILLIDIVFGDRVEGRGRLVEEEHRPVLVEGARQHQPLGFAARQLDPVLKDLPPDVGAEPLGEGFDLFGQPRLMKTAPDLLFVDPVHLLGDVFGKRRVQNRKVLEDGREEGIVFPAVEPADVDAV